MNDYNFITAPSYYIGTFPENTIKIFLAGTIDSGNSKNWQMELIRKFQERNNPNIFLFNPRRDNWPKDSDHNEVEKQINWEHKYLDDSDLIIMNILPDSKSPISLMEIGLYAQSGKLIVFCNENFYRYDNVKLVCKKYNIPIYDYNDSELIYLTTKQILFDTYFKLDNKEH